MHSSSPLTTTRPPGPGRRSRRRALFAFGGLALLLHLALLGAASGPGIGADKEPVIGGPVAVRTIELPAIVPPAVVIARATPVVEASARLPIPSTRATPARPASSPSVRVAVEPRPEPLPAEAAETFPPLEANTQAAIEPERNEAAADSGLMKVALAAPRSASASFLAAGERPPPVYRTVLPGPVTLRYELRRGFFRGTSEIHWRPEGDRYVLQFEARVAGISLLSQSSQGGLDATGLAPVRFLDQRARRAARSVNFSRDTGTISFSGSTAQWPLLAGTQDRLSWMIQLGGIVAANPALASGNGKISMVLVSARGEAAVRTLRFVGRENAETVSGSVPALKFVVDGHSAYDDSFEIWLDPARGYLPAHATSRSSAGEAEFELLLLRAEP